MLYTYVVCFEAGDKVVVVVVVVVVLVVAVASAVVVSVAGSVAEVAEVFNTSCLHFIKSFKIFFTYT